MSVYSFNLVEKQWIPCVDSSGELLHMGIRDLLVNAHELRGLEHQNPLTEAALMRVLLAVVHRIVDGPKDQPEWIGLYKAGRLPAERIDAYLNQWRHRFDLFSDKEPFYQTAGLTILDSDDRPSPVSISNIMLERSSGNNRTIFDHTTDDTPVKLTFAEASNALITAQMYSLDGLYRKKSNLFKEIRTRCETAAMVNGIFVALSGDTLFETLMLNLLIYKDNEPLPNSGDDKPVWERTDRGGDDKTTPKGYLDFLTCKCRHILLVPAQHENNMFVQEIHFAQGEIYSDIINPSCIVKKNDKKGRLYHPRLDTERLVWRDSLALFAFDQQNDNRPKAFRQASMMHSAIRPERRYACKTIGMAKDPKQPIVYCWRRESLVVPIALFSDRELVAYMKKALELSEQTGSTLRDAARRYIRECLPPNAKNEDVAKLTEATGSMRLYWDRLDQQFQIFLIEIEKRDVALDAWTKNIKRTARESLESCMKERYSKTAKVYKAWTKASAYLNINLSKLS